MWKATRPARKPAGGKDCSEAAPEDSISLFRAAYYVVHHLGGLAKRKPCRLFASEVEFRAEQESGISCGSSISVSIVSGGGKLGLGSCGGNSSGNPGNHHACKEGGC